MQFTRSTWWNIEFKVTLNLIVAETCNIEKHIAYFMVIKLFF